MAAAGWLPTLSQIETVPSEQLREAARTWRTTATRWEDVFAQLRDEAAQKVVLQGATADALEARTYNDWLKAAGKASQLHEAAGIAELGADQLDGAQEHALDAVAQARADGFQVAEDLSVTDTRTGGSREERAARQVLALEHAAYIRYGAAGLVAYDRGISTKMLATTEGLGTISFNDAPIPGIDDTPSNKTEHNGVQAVGFGRQPEAPRPGDPTPPHKPTKTAKDVSNALDPLEEGINKGIKTLPTPEQIRKAFEGLTQNAREAPNPTYPGERRVLDDGTIIGIRESQKWGPTLDVRYPDGTQQKVHLPKPVEGANPPPASTEPAAPPIISTPPNLPPELNHPPVTTVPPAQPGHPPVTLPPTQVIDPARLPPWLENPSPPGFHVSPGEPPPFAPIDMPDARAAPAPTYTPPPGGQSSTCRRSHMTTPRRPAQRQGSPGSREFWPGSL